MASKTFEGGIHPDDNKDLTKNESIYETPLPKKVVIFLSQHIGGLATPLVAVGDLVKTGQKIAEPTGYVSIPMHASISGKVTAIADFHHPSGSLVRGIEIESDARDEWIELIDDPDYMTLSNEEMIRRIAEAGICGMGGAGFPTHVKLVPPADKPIDTVIVNGAECEPYLTADCRLMIEHPENIIKGLKIVMKILGAKQGIIGIESNKPLSIKSLRKLCKKEKYIRVEKLKLKYPQGAEKQIIYATTKRVVPNRGGLPYEVGCIVDNVATIINIYEAVRRKRPLIERVITVSGKILRKPSNISMRIGTKFSELIEMCGGVKKPIAKIISGGPMMGFALDTLETYSTKTSSGLIVLENCETYKTNEHECLRCGRCVDVCPQNLLPSFIASAIKFNDLKTADKAGALDCMKCGSCTYVCPAHIKLIQWIDLAKTRLKSLDNKA
jgi:electron transport complex protein RnfC